MGISSIDTHGLLFLFLLGQSAIVRNKVETQPVSSVSNAKPCRRFLQMFASGSGIGKILIQQAENEARKQGNKKLHLNVNKKNKAVGFYQKLGFTVDYEEVLDIGNGYVMDDFVMVKDLS